MWGISNCKKAAWGIDFAPNRKSFDEWLAAVAKPGVVLRKA
jgi:hypothetical protein